ncbi:MAG: hypothetical protein WCJ64_07460 [Rhodospirillaceae bacterium]
MASPVASQNGTNGALSSYTFATAKQAKAVQSALDNAYNSASHKDAIKALSTLTGATTSPTQVNANKAVATLSGTTTSASQTAANKALVTLTALANANDMTQKFIMAQKAATPYGAQSGLGSNANIFNLIA